MLSSRSGKSPITLALAVLLTLPFLTSRVQGEDAKPIPIAEVKRDAPVDFEKDVLPIFRRNCLACHNSTDAESELVLETPAAIRKGGAEGPAVVPGKGQESVLIQVAARMRESHMPPADNDVGAKPLTSEELGLIKLWIDQGAEGEVLGLAGPVQWQPLPAGVNPIFAADISDDGRYAAVGRANQIFVYDVGSQRELGRLTDPKAVERGGYEHPGVAHLDMVQALSFSPDGRWLASGGFRVVKLWERRGGSPITRWKLQAEPRCIAAHPSGLTAMGLANGEIQVLRAQAEGLEDAGRWKAHEAAIVALALDQAGGRLLSVADNNQLRVWKLEDRSQLAQWDAPAKTLAAAVVGEHAVAAGEDKIIRVWPLPATVAAATAAAAPPAEEKAAEEKAAEEKAAEEKAGEEKAGEEKAGEPQPVAAREITGHGDVVTVLTALGGEQLASGSKDGTVRIWQIADGKMVRQLAMGGPVTALAAAPDGAKLAAAGENKVIRIWTAADGKQVAEFKGDFQTQLAAAAAARVAALAKSRVTLAEADLKGGNDRKKSEEENAKKAKEALTKAEEELKKKTEEAKQPMADKEAAEKELQAANQRKTDAEANQKKAVEAAAKAAQELKAGQAAAQAAQQAAVNAANVAKQAEQAVQAAAKALEGDAENEDLKNKKAEADAKLEEAKKAAVEAQKKKEAADKIVVDLTKAQQAADQAKTASDKELADAGKAIKPAEDKAKKTADAAKKAVDAQTVAQRGVEASKRSVQRADASVQKAAEQIKELEAAKVVEDQALEAANQLSEAAKAKAAESEKPATDLAFVDGGQTLAFTSDGKVFTYDVASATPLERCVGPAAQRVASAAGDRMVTLDQDGHASLWTSRVGWELARVIGSPDAPEPFVDRVTALDFSADGQLLATGGGEPSRSGQLQIFKPETGELVRALVEPHSDTVFQVAFSRNGEFIASCGADRFVKVFRTQDGSFVRSFEGHTHHVLGVAWSADGRRLASSGADKVVKIWDAITGDQRRTISGYGKEVTDIDFVGDSLNVLSTSGDRSVAIKNSDNGGNVRGFSGAGDYVYCGAVSADGKRILAAGQDSVLRIWDDAGKLVAEFKPPEPGK